MENEFAKAYDLYADGVYKHCLFKVSDQNIALDLMQETFTKVWLYLREGKKADNLKALLYKTANNLVIDYYRKKKSVSLESLQSEGFDVAEERVSPEADSEVELVKRALQSIDEPYRTAVSMRYINDMTPQEISEVTGDTVNVISVRINRGMKKLQKVMNIHEQG